MTSTAHYSLEYWNYQRPIGEAGGVLNKFKFEHYIRPSDVVLDFGCGGGFLLNNLACARRLGIEISPFARQNAEQLGIQVFSSYAEVPDGSVDVIISNHAFEHVQNPFEVLQGLHAKLRVGGKIAIVVPCEQPHELNFSYRPDDVNQHLYTWCPMSLGNLVTHAGYAVLEAQPLQHQWTPDFLTAYRSEPLEQYHARCREFAQNNGNVQVRVVAERRS